MESDFSGPVNIGSEEMVTINELAEMTMNNEERSCFRITLPDHSARAGATRTIA
jgi:hypothetical protein